MKRNLDLIRNMLLLIEANDKPSGMDSSAFTSLNPDSDIIDYHLYLLADSGYIDYSEVNTIGHFYPQIIVNWMTNAGCDYLDAVRSASIWKTTKNKLSEIGGQASLDVVKTVAEHFALSALGI